MTGLRGILPTSDFRIATWNKVLKSIMQTHAHKLLQPDINTETHNSSLVIVTVEILAD